MTRKIQALLLAGLLPLAGTAMAQSVSQVSYPRIDVTGFQPSTTALVTAIGKVQQTTGGRVLEIRYAEVNGEAGFHAVVAKGDSVQFMHLEQKSGRLTPIDEHTTPDWMLNWRNKADVHFAESAKVPLVQAIENAEQQDNNAPAIAAGIARSASNPTSEVHAYNVLLDMSGTERRLAVDDKTGQVIADPQALAAWL